MLTPMSTLHDLELHIDLAHMNKHQTARTTPIATYKPKVSHLPTPDLLIYFSSAIFVLSTEVLSRVDIATFKSKMAHLYMSCYLISFR